MRFVSFLPAVASVRAAAATIIAAGLMCFPATPSHAVEGSTAAGPIGGTDIRSALLPPPGIYGGVAVGYGDIQGFNDGDGNSIPALEDLEQSGPVGGIAGLYVPDFQVFGGSLGALAVIKGGQECGRLFSGQSRKCVHGFGDPYVEIGWSRFFGDWRFSEYEDSYPIPEGLTVYAGFGVVLPFGDYDRSAMESNGVTLGDNIWDFAPTAAITYVTPPLIADGTELSAKVFWNNYLENPDTDYQTGDLINVDFALSERIGPAQVGLAGIYAVQIEDDEQFGMTVPPDGRRAQVLSLGAVGAWDLPSIGAQVKLKGVHTVVSENTVEDGWGITLTFVKQLW
ncbi:MAG: transporter [Pseudomonadota bacterium]